MSKLSNKLHYKLDGTTDEITLYSTEGEAGSNPATFGMNGIKCYAATGSSSDSNSSRMNYKDNNGTRKILKQAASSDLAYINCLAYRCDETTLIQALPVQKLELGQTFYINDFNAPSISGYNFICAIPNNFVITNDMVTSGVTVKVYYMPNSVFDRNRTNWSYQYQNQTLDQTDLWLTDYCNTSAATLMTSMWEGTNIITAPKMNMSKVTDTQRMFANCPNLTEFIGSNYDLSSIGVSNRMFYGSSAIKTLDLTGMDNLQYCTVMCLGCTSVTSLKLPKMRKVYQTTQAFQSLNSLTSIDFSETELGGDGNLTSIQLMCYSMPKLEKVDLSNCYLGTVHDFQRVFHYCTSLKEIVGELDMSGATNVTNMLGSTGLTTPVKLKNVPRSLDLSTIGSNMYEVLNYID